MQICFGQKPKFLIQVLNFKFKSDKYPNYQIKHENNQIAF